MKYLQYILISLIFSYVSLNEFSFNSQIAIELNIDLKETKTNFENHVFNFKVIYYENLVGVNYCFDKNTELENFLNAAGVNLITESVAKEDDGIGIISDDNDDLIDTSKANTEVPVTIEDGKEKLCFVILYSLCNNKLTKCSIFEKERKLYISITFTHTTEIANNDLLDINKYISKQRTNMIRSWVGNGYSALKTNLGENDFFEMSLNHLREMYYILVLALEDKFASSLAHNAIKDRLNIHINQNVYFYKDNMLDILQHFKKCGSGKDENNTVKGIIEALEGVLDLNNRGIQNDVLEKWNAYEKELKNVRLEGGFFKPIFTSYFSNYADDEDGAIFSILYNDNLMPEKLSIPQRDKNPVMRDFLLHPVCSGNAIKLYMKNTLESDFIELFELYEKRKRKFKKRFK
jgi:hypothetical protein